MIKKDKLLNVQQAAEILGVNVRTLYMWNWMKKNLPFIKVGRSLRISEKDLFDFIEKGKRFPKEG